MSDFAMTREDSVANELSKLQREFDLYLVSTQV